MRRVGGNRGTGNSARGNSYNQYSDRDQGFSGFSNNDSSRQNTMYSNSSTPFSNQYQDMDIEYEIFKRKRQMIQQEHELLDREREFVAKRAYEYQNPTSSYSYPTNDYSQNLYQQQGFKRQAVEDSPRRHFNQRQNQSPRINPWANGAETTIHQQQTSYSTKLPSLLHIASKYPSSKFNSRPKYFPKQEQQFPKQEKPFPRKNFNPTRVTKSTVRSAYIKPKPNKPAFNPLTKDIVLRPSVPPSNKVKGRLELALGEIVKLVKISATEQELMKLTSNAERVMKRIIRERIWSLMMNKPVKFSEGIVKLYREKYPESTDQEIIKAALELQSCSFTNFDSVPISDTDTPEVFIKANFLRILSDKIRSLTKAKTEVSDVVIVDDASVDSEVEKKDDEKPIDVDDVVVEKSNNQDTIDVDEVEVEIKDNKEPIDVDKLDEEKKGDQEPIDVDEEMSPDVEKDMATIKEYKELVNHMLNGKVDRAMARLKDSFLRMLNEDQDFIEEKRKIEEDTVNMATEILLEKMKHRNSPKKNDDVIEVINDNSPIDLTSDKDDEGVSEGPIADKPENDSPFYVKVIGQPKLPTRSACYKFLRQFNPGPIKKHKTIHELLVVCLKNKEDYEKILLKSGTVIGYDKLIVNSGELVTPEPQTQKDQQKKDDIQTIDTKQDQEKSESVVDEPSGTDSAKAYEENQSDGDKNDTETDESNSLNISDTLDAQITSLLTAVRKESECESNKKEIDTAEVINLTDTNHEEPNNDDNIGESVSKVNAAENQDNTDDQDNEIEKQDKKIAGITNESGPATPVKAATRLANSTPSSIRTRRASRLAK
ncbi:unnamed protein product [Leptidea sinapis]|uniref:Uncharacterized protein n=1 Tax=Leptidea sinapis TaxID=189913 RepID=A0A5E4Q6I1_9NEOP|nr:unnamed protein product [Leptidea sinapis]